MDDPNAVQWRRLTMRRIAPGKYAGKFENEESVGEAEFEAWQEGSGEEPPAILVAQEMRRDYGCDVILETNGDPPRICFLVGPTPWKRADGS